MLFSQYSFVQFRNASLCSVDPRRRLRSSSRNSILFLINYKFSSSYELRFANSDFLHDVTMSYYRSPTYPRSVNSVLPISANCSSYDGTAGLSPSNIRQVAPRCALETRPSARVDYLEVADTARGRKKERGDIENRASFVWVSVTESRGRSHMCVCAYVRVCYTRATFSQKSRSLTR